MLQTPLLISAFHSLASLLLSKRCFQAEDVGVAEEGGLPAAGKENIRLCSLATGLLPPNGCLRGGLQGLREVGEIPQVA